MRMMKWGASRNEAIERANIMATATSSGEVVFGLVGGLGGCTHEYCAAIVLDEEASSPRRIERAERGG